MEVWTEPRDARYWYLQSFKKGHILTQEQEAVISESSEYSYVYALMVLKTAFPAGEPAIAENSYRSYLYARNVLQGPFALGESAISTSCNYSYLYATEVLKSRFPAGEHAIANSVSLAYQYAYRVLLDPRPETWGLRFLRIKGDYNPWKALQEM